MSQQQNVSDFVELLAQNYELILLNLDQFFLITMATFILCKLIIVLWIVLTTVRIWSHLLWHYFSQGRQCSLDEFVSLKLTEGC